MGYSKREFEKRQEEYPLGEEHRAELHWMEQEQYDDMVHSPPHYTNGNGIECIDYIRQVLGEEGFVYFCHGNQNKTKETFSDENANQE